MQFDLLRLQTWMFSFIDEYPHSEKILHDFMVWIVSRTNESGSDDGVPTEPSDPPAPSP